MPDQEHQTTDGEFCRRVKAAAKHHGSADHEDAVSIAREADAERAALLSGDHHVCWRKDGEGYKATIATWPLVACSVCYRTVRGKELGELNAEITRLRAALEAREAECGRLRSGLIMAAKHAKTLGPKALESCKAVSFIADDALSAPETKTP